MGNKLSNLVTNYNLQFDLNENSKWDLVGKMPHLNQQPTGAAISS